MLGFIRHKFKYYKMIRDCFTCCRLAADSVAVVEIVATADATVCCDIDDAFTIFVAVGVTLTQI